jgi:hypothetical protein
MVRGSSEIFKKLKAMAVLSAVLLSALVMSSISSISTNSNGSSTVGDGILGDSYADIGRPSFLVPGRYLNYSVDFGLVPGLVNKTTTNITANLHYQFNSVAGPYYSITERTTNLNVSYGYTNPERIMGFYNTGVSNVTRLAEQYRGYSGSGTIKASVLNLTNFNNRYSFTTNLNMYTANGSFGSASGNGTNQIIVDTILPASGNRLYYFGYYRTILSYYQRQGLGTLYRSPKALFNPMTNFTIDGTASVATYLGTRSAVKFVRNILNAKPIYNGSYGDWKWQEILYFDVYTGVLIKAIMYVDNNIDKSYYHQLEFNLIDSNLDFGEPTPSPKNVFEDALVDIKQYLATSALNDTNRSLFHHAAIGDAAAPSNSTKLSADTFKIIFGYDQAFETPLTTLFYEANASLLRDVESGGFYRSMNAGGTTVDDVKTVTDAAWAILGSSVLGSTASRFQQEMFTYMRNNHYGNGTYSGFTFYAFARYNKTSDTVFYAYDNLIAYLALNWLAFYHTNVTLKAQARDMAYKVISLFSAPSSFPGFLNGSLFVTSIDRNGLFAGTEKSTLDALLAIFALSQYYVFNQSAPAKATVDRAIGAFNKLLAKAWNATNKGFIHQLDFNLNVNDANQYLEDNAWALAASLALLEAANKAYPAVKNITYYDVACDTWGAIKKVLYDSQNKTFRAASNNRASFAGDLGVILFSLSGMLATSRATTLTVTTNATDNKFVYENLKPVKAIVTWKLNMNRTLPSPLAMISTLIPLNYSDVYFKVRYSNQTIYDEIFSVTDNSGVASFVFPIPTPPEFTDMDPTRKSETAHLIGVVANRTGFEVKEAFREFYITSGITVWTDPKNPAARFDFSGDKFTAYFNNRTEPESVPSIYPGDNLSVSINISSSVTHAQNITITFEGDIINTVSEVKTVNASAANATYTFQLTAKGDIPTEMQAMNFSISKNGSAILEGEIPVYVKIPVLLTNVKYAAYMVDNSPYIMTFNVKNLNKNRNESVNLAFSSVNLERVGGNNTFNITNIEPNQEIPESISLQLKTDHAELNVYQFSIALSWENVSLGTLVYYIPFRAPIEILSISGPSNPIQGSPMIYAFLLRSNLASAADVSVIIYRVLNTGATSVVSEVPVTLAPGSNNFIVSCKDPLDNPWDIGSREYRVVVMNGLAEVGRETVMANVEMSLESILLGYVLVFGAFGIVFLLIFNKKRQLDSVRR